jgi:endo-1,4-beta-xylanase
MEEMRRRDLAGMAVLGAVGLTGATQAQAAGSESPDALAKAKGFVGFGSCMGGGAEDFASSFNDSGVRAIHQRDCGILVCENETKWVALRPNPKEYSFYLAGRTCAAAARSGLL